MKQKDHRLITEEELKRTVKAILDCKPPEKSLYENRKPTEEELNQRFKYVPRKGK